MKTFYFITAISCMFFIPNVQGQSFITRWDLFIQGTSPNQISFGVETVGQTNYTWETVPAGLSGSGSFVGPIATITGLPANSIIRLIIDTTNFRRISVNNGNNVSPLTDRNRLIDVEQWGGVHWNSMEIAFLICNNLNISATDIPDLSSVTSMQGMFSGCKSLTGPTNIGSWDVSHINDMKYLFSQASKFNQAIDTWDVSNVTDMSYMFSMDTSFNQALNNWNTLNVTDMNSMFNGAEGFNQPIDNWNTSNVTDMSSMFFWATSFNQPIGIWNTSNVTNMSRMFNHASNFNQSIGNWNTVNVTDMSRMFYEAYDFNEPIGSWNTVNVTNMSEMFSAANSFNQPIGTWNTINVTDMSYMFDGAFDFNQPIENWNTMKVTNMSCMFRSALVFNQPIGNWNISNVTDISYMFAGAKIFNQPIGTWNTNNITGNGLVGIFRTAKNFNQPIDTWNVSSVTNLDYVFQGATNFNQALSNWDISNVNSMTSIFNGATKFNQPLNNWNTAQVTDMYSAFKGATDFNQPLNNWNTANVTTMSSMFNSATSFNQPISSWDISKWSNASAASSLLDYCGMDCPNYTALLNSWGNNNNTPNNITLGARNLIYGTNGATLRDNLVSSKHWNIIGDTVSGFKCVQYPLSILDNTSTTINYSIIPNPSNGISFLEIESSLNEAISVSIFDMFGRELEKKHTSIQVGQNKINLPINALAQGVYFVRFVLNQQTYSLKLELIK